MKGIFNLLTRNWGLKITALLLAIVIYYSLKQDRASLSKNNDRTFFQQPN